MRNATSILSTALSLFLLSLSSACGAISDGVTCKNDSDCSQGFCNKGICAVESEGPQFIDLQPQQGTLLASGEVTISGALSDGKGAGPSHLEWSVDRGTTFQRLDLIENAFSLTLPTTDSDFLPFPVTLRALDRLSNLTQVELALAVDRVAPRITLELPSRTQFTRSDCGLELSLEAKLSDDSPDALLTEWSNDGGATWNGAQDDRLVAYRVPVECDLAPKRFHFWVRSTDSAGNGSQRESGPFSIDTVAPILTLTSPADESTYSGPASGTLILAGNLAEAALESFGYRIDGGALQELVRASDGSFSKLIPLPAEDSSHLLTVEATDIAGNLASSSVRYHLLRKGPAITIESPFDPNLQERRGTLERISLERLPFSVIGSLDETPATVEIVYGEAKLRPDVDTAGRFTQLLPLPKADDEEQLIAVTAIDNLGNSTRLERRFLLDTSAPTLSVEAPAEESHLSLAKRALSVQGTCAEASLASLSWSFAPEGEPEEKESELHPITLIEGHFSIQIEAPIIDRQLFRLKLAARDRAGNSTLFERTYWVDTVAPSLSPSALPKERYSAQESKLDLAAGASDGDMSLSVAALIDGVALPLRHTEPLWSAIYTLADEDLTAHTFAYRAMDSAGNETLSETITFYVDRRAPVITLAQPLAGAILNALSDKLTVRGSYSDKGGAEGAVTFNGERVTVSTSPFEVEFSLPAAKEEHSLPVVVTATDSHGNMATVTRALTVDTAPPVISCPIQAAQPLGAPTKAECTVANCKSCSVTLKIDGAAATLTHDAKTGKYSFDMIPTGIEGSVHTAKLMATDAAGNGVEASYTWKRDTQKPTIAITTPSADGACPTCTATKCPPCTGAIYNAAMTEFSANGTFADSNPSLLPSSFAAKFGTTNCTVTVGANMTWSAKCTGNSTLNGELSFTITVDDLAGNRSAQAARSVHVDRIAPTVSLAAERLVTANAPILTYSEPLTRELSFTSGTGASYVLSSTTTADKLSINAPAYTSLEVTVSNIARDPAGNPLANPGTFKFLTAPKSLALDATARTTGQLCTNPVVRIDADNRPFVAATCANNDAKVFALTSDNGALIQASTETSAARLHDFALSTTLPSGPMPPTLDYSMLVDTTNNFSLITTARGARTQLESGALASDRTATMLPPKAYCTLYASPLSSDCTRHVLLGRAMWLSGESAKVRTEGNTSVFYPVQTLTHTLNSSSLFSHGAAILSSEFWPNQFSTVYYGPTGTPVISYGLGRSIGSHTGLAPATLEANPNGSSNALVAWVETSGPNTMVALKCSSTPSDESAWSPLTMVKMSGGSQLALAATNRNTAIAMIDGSGYLNTSVATTYDSCANMAQLSSNWVTRLKLNAAHRPSLAFGANGELYVAYVDTTSSSTSNLAILRIR